MSSSTNEPGETFALRRQLHRLGMTREDLQEILCDRALAKEIVALAKERRHTRISKEIAETNRPLSGYVALDNLTIVAYGFTREHVEVDAQKKGCRRPWVLPARHVRRPALEKFLGRR